MADNKSFADIGLHIMEAGLSFQVASLLVFIVFCTLFALKCWHRREELDPRFADLRKLGRFCFFLCGESRSLLRSIYLRASGFRWWKHGDLDR